MKEKSEESPADRGLEYYFEELLNHRQEKVRKQIAVLYNHYKLLRRYMLDVFDPETKEFKIKTDQDWINGLASTLKIWERK